MYSIMQGQNYSQNYRNKQNKTTKQSNTDKQQTKNKPFCNSQNWKNLLKQDA